MQAAQMEKVLPWAIIALFLWFFWVYASGWFKTHLRRRHSMAARVVGKRVDFAAGDKPAMVYFVTFQTAEGKRMEFSVPGKTYGLLVERDQGVLTLKGSDFLEFKRN